MRLIDCPEAVAGALAAELPNKADMQALLIIGLKTRPRRLRLTAR